MEEKRDVIINAAESQFVRFGFRKTTMEDIAKAAGIGKATLYYYFKSKEDIFAAMAEGIAQTGVQAIVDAAQTGETPQARLRIFGSTLAQFMKRKIDYYAAFREEFVEMFPSVRKKQKKAEGYVLAALQNILQEGIDQHIFAISDVEATAQLILLLMLKLTEQIVVEENLSTWNDDVNLFLELILRGLDVRN